MRIISGQHKGRRIYAPKNLPVRPTKDIAKEALFNILNSRFYLDELSVLDLFSGTGSISYEFASRGAENITAVDSHYNCIKFIEETSSEFRFPIHTIKSDAYKYLESTSNSFDIIFADPPYDFTLEEFSSIPEIVFRRNLLNEDGLLIVEHSKKDDLSHLANFEVAKFYGGSVFSLFNSQSIIDQ